MLFRSVLDVLTNCMRHGRQVLLELCTVTAKSLVEYVSISGCQALAIGQDISLVVVSYCSRE